MMINNYIFLRNNIQGFKTLSQETYRVVFVVFAGIIFTCQILIVWLKTIFTQRLKRLVDNATGFGQQLRKQLLVLAVVGGWLVLHEAPGPGFWEGAALIAAGNAVNLWRRR